MSPSTASTPERIVKAAVKLFYAEGIRAVSMDAVAQKAGVTKRTLYYHFESKDDLVAAYLQTRDQPNLAFFQRCFAGTQGDVADKVAGIFRELARAAGRPGWKGCGFLRTSVELVNMPGHPAMKAARLHKRRVEEWLDGVFKAAGISTPESLARQIVLLLDGSFATTLLHRDPAYMEDAAEAALTLIRAARPPAKAGLKPRRF